MMLSLISERLHYLTYVGALIFLPVEQMSHAAREHGNVTVFSGSDSSFVFFLILFHANTKKKKILYFVFFSLLASHNLVFLCPLYSPFNVISPFALFPPSSSSWLCFRQASQSVIAMCRSGTSLRETVDWTMWRSASAGDAACRGLMSSWRYAEETHTYTQKILLSEASLMCIDLNMSDNCRHSKGQYSSKVD